MLQGPNLLPPIAPHYKGSGNARPAPVPFTPLSWATGKLAVRVAIATAISDPPNTDKVAELSLPVIGILFDEFPEQMRGFRIEGATVEEAGQARHRHLG